MKLVCHSVFIANLKSRVDRRRHIVNQFVGRKEFKTQIIEPVKHEIAAVSLWETVRHIIKDLTKPENEYIIFCEDDHEFTMEYSKEKLSAIIKEAKVLQADVLACGVSGFTGAVPISNRIYWVEKFSGTQFIVIFRKIMSALLMADFGPGDTADFKICSLTENKFFAYPFLSTQKDFGYSDVTPMNDKSGLVEAAFLACDEKIRLLQDLERFYFEKKLQTSTYSFDIDPNRITIPAYIINLPERTDRLSHIKKQFEEKPEFDVNLIEASRHPIGAMGLWQSITRIIKIASKKDEDIVLICEDDHEFTKNYNREGFIKSIWEAGTLGCNVLSGGIGRFNVCAQITENMFWIDAFWCTQFIVIYKRFFNNILDEPFGEMDAADLKLSEMTSHKMVMFPFISIQKDFGYSDATPVNNNDKGMITRYFEETSGRFASYYHAGKKCKQSPK